VREREREGESESERERERGGGESVEVLPLVPEGEDAIVLDPTAGGLRSERTGEFFATPVDEFEAETRRWREGERPERGVEMSLFELTVAPTTVQLSVRSARSNSAMVVQTEGALVHLPPLRLLRPAHGPVQRVTAAAATAYAVHALEDVPRLLSSLLLQSTLVTISSAFPLASGLISAATSLFAAAPRPRTVACDVALELSSALVHDQDRAVVPFVDAFARDLMLDEDTADQVKLSPSATWRRWQLGLRAWALICGESEVVAVFLNCTYRRGKRTAAQAVVCVADTCVVIVKPPPDFSRIRLPLALPKAVSGRKVSLDKSNVLMMASVTDAKSLGHLVATLSRRVVTVEKE
jgi:hypothetical protein